MQRKCCKCRKCGGMEMKMQMRNLASSQEGLPLFSCFLAKTRKFIGMCAHTKGRMPRKVVTQF